MSTVELLNACCASSRDTCVNTTQVSARNSAIQRVVDELASLILVHFAPSLTVLTVLAEAAEAAAIISPQLSQPFEIASSLNSATLYGSDAAGEPNHATPWLHPNIGQ
jgi:hypothetical protein